jgi:hypothetical protein
MHNQLPPGGMPAMGIHQQQAMLAHQNTNMEMMERRQRERQAAERTANPQAVRVCLSHFFPCVYSFVYLSFYTEATSP